MNDVVVSNYGIFDDAISISNSYTESIDAFSDACGKFQSAIGDGSIFMGPVADSYVAAFSSINNTCGTMVQENKKLCDYLISVSGNYQAADTNASNEVTSADLGSSPSTTANPGMAMTTGASTTGADVIATTTGGDTSGGEVKISAGETIEEETRVSFED